MSGFLDVRLMVEANEIRDEESLRTWLEGRAPEDAVVVAVRAALRVAPFVWCGKWHDRSLVSLVVCHQLVVAVAAGRALTKAIEGAALAATMHSNEYLNAVALAADNVTDAAQGVANTAATVVHANPDDGDSQSRAAARTIGGAVYAVDAHIGSGREILEQAAVDARAIEARDDLLAAPLWSGQHPEWFRTLDAEMRASWDAVPAFSFWLRWWDGVLSGRQIDWALQEKVALIPTEIWEQGAEAVAKEIARIEAERRNAARIALSAEINAKPYALGVEVDGATATLVAAELRDFELSEIITTINASIRDFTRRTHDMMSGNQPGRALREVTAPAVRDLRRDTRRYANSPLRLHDAISDAISETVSAARREGVLKEPVLERLVANWARQQTDLCVACPELLETVQRRTMVRVAQFTDAEMRQALALGQGLHNLSSGHLKMAAAWALKTVQSPSATEAEKKGAWYFLAAVLPRGAQAALQAADPKQSDGDKSGDFTKRMKDAADVAIAGDKVVDVVQENIPELVDFGHWVVSEVTSGHWFGLGRGFGG